MAGLRWLPLGLMLLTAGCSGSSGPAPIYVGHVATLSGPEKNAGEQAKRGIRLAVQEQNKDAEKKNVRPIHVRHTDTRGKVDAFEAEAVRLVTVSQAKALLGGTTIEEVARLDKAQVPIVTPAPRVRGSSELVFSTGIPPAFQGQTLARFTFDNLKATRVMIFVDDRRDDAALLAESFTRELIKTAADKKADQPARVTRRRGKDTPLADWPKRLAEEKPQAVLLVSEFPELRTIRTEMHFTGPILFGGAEVGARALLDISDLEGIYLVTALTGDLDTPVAKAFVAGYREAYNEDPDVHAALAYEGARLLFQAIGTSPPSLAPDGIIKELAGLKDFAGLTGALTFTAEHQLVRPAFVVQAVKGEVRTVRRFAP